MAEASVPEKSEGRRSGEACGRPPSGNALRCAQESGRDVTWGRNIAKQLIAAFGLAGKGPPCRVQFEDSQGAREELIVGDRLLLVSNPQFCCKVAYGRVVVNMAGQ